ncbi:1,2-phenylacetyl-CoA epoxidase subunit PaaC [Maritimibacter dapengensis]|uniref:Phenylacetate-CoA oxygenase subunit PaaC n=1 Tax=Maritimibacter dapengensis TaxID=2836868 RepID=A0ABS6SYV8_9RHOB|nr:1,2-phenylacetyl-CoA epoxidase subunit PaaC [Maritimibacter dapengensis]MBV7378074.1 phenylacetate-CoA oxygenase subunit PaaC [Maritimibacter dapengensis]
MADAKFEALLRLGDNALILGHRVSEWCGHAPVLEEDIALANTALDLLGQTNLWLEYAGEVEGKGRSADDLAFLRDAWDFRNVLLVELPNGDFGQTIMRQYLFDQFNLLNLRALTESKDTRIAEIAEKAAKEAAYHVERSRGTVVGLGDGTQESHARMQEALNLLYPYALELFITDEVDDEMAEAGVFPDPKSLEDAYLVAVAATLQEATLDLPEAHFGHRGSGKDGRMHTEHLGHILTQMQWLQRAYPGQTW